MYQTEKAISNNSKLDDSAFMSQFEDCSLSPDNFDHIGHLRIAWLYISQYGSTKAIDLVCDGINTYAKSLGANDKFHFTITASLVKIIASSIKEQSTKSWQVFLQQNDDLVSDALGVLYRYFSKSKLHSELARTSLLEPDLQEIS